MLDLTRGGQAAAKPAGEKKAKHGDNAMLYEPGTTDEVLPTGKAVEKGWITAPKKFLKIDGFAGRDKVFPVLKRLSSLAESLLVTPEALQGLLACDLYSDMPFDIANTLRDALGELRAMMWREPCKGELIFFDQTEVEFSMTLLVRRNIDSPQPYTLVTLR